MIRKLAAAFAVAAMSLGAAAQAQDYPNQPVRIIHGFGPGGNADTVSRLIAEPLSARFGQPFVVEPKPGAGGQVAMDYIANSAEADGYTLQLLVGGHSVVGALYQNLKFDAVEDFTFINRISYFPFFVAARPGVYADIGALVAAAKDGGRVRWGSAGVGTTQHLTGELLRSETDANFLHIPYKGDAGAVTALLGGEIDMVVSAGTSVLNQAKAGELDILAVTWDRGWPDMPDVPTLGDTVAPGFNVFSWLGLGAPAGLPEDVTNALAAALGEIVVTPEMTESLNALGGTPAPMTPAEFRDMVAGQVKTWNGVIDAAGIERK